MSLGPLFKSTGFCGRLFYQRLFPSRGHWWSFPCQYKHSRANQLHRTTKPSISMELASALKVSPLRWTPYFDVYVRHVAPRPASVSFSCHCYSISSLTFWLKTTSFPISVFPCCRNAGHDVTSKRLSLLLVHYQPHVAVLASPSGLERQCMISFSLNLRKSNRILSWLFM